MSIKTSIYFKKEQPWINSEAVFVYRRYIYQLFGKVLLKPLKSL